MSALDRNELTLKYWRYNLQLDSQFMEAIEYGELHPSNFSAFSNRYALLIQAIGAELDSLFKFFCGFDLSARKSIYDYAGQILQNNPNIVNQKIKLRQFGLAIQPFQGWDATHAAQSLSWWSAFTNIKHNRSAHIQESSQQNTLNILGALYLLEMLCLRKISEATHEPDVYDIRSNLFTLENWTTTPETIDDAFMLLADIIESDGSESDLKFDA